MALKHGYDFKRDYCHKSLAHLIFQTDDKLLTLLIDVVGKDIDYKLLFDS